MAGGGVVVTLVSVGSTYLGTPDWPGSVRDASDPRTAVRRLSEGFPVPPGLPDRGILRPRTRTRAKKPAREGGIRSRPTSTLSCEVGDAGHGAASSEAHTAKRTLYGQITMRNIVTFIDQLSRRPESNLGPPD